MQRVAEAAILRAHEMALEGSNPVDADAARSVAESALLPAEEDALDLLSDFWRLYCDLPLMHDADRAEAVPHVHALQQLIAMRVAQRTVPGVFPIKRVIVPATPTMWYQAPNEDFVSTSSCPACRASVELLIDTRPPSRRLEASCTGIPSHSWVVELPS